MQCNNTRQEYKSIQFNNTITTQVDREVERMATTRLIVGSRGDAIYKSIQ